MKSDGNPFRIQNTMAVVIKEKTGRERSAMKKKLILAVTVLMGAGLALAGCGDSSKTSDGKTKIEMVQYKPEAVKAFEKMEEKFNETHDDIELTIESPNEAMTILKTRFIKEDQPDIIGIGGDVNYSNFLDSDMLMDISDFDGLKDIKQSYLDIDKNLEFIPEDGTYAVPYWQMQQEFFITKKCSKKMAGRSRQLGMNS